MNAALAAIQASIGDLSQLQTSDKTSLVNALNNLLSLIQNDIQVPQPLDCSGNPDYPAATEGQSWKVTAAGRIGGANGINVMVGDMIVCMAASTGGDQATAGDNFYLLQTNLDLATQTTPGIVRLATLADMQNQTPGVAVTPDILAQSEEIPIIDTSANKDFNAYVTPGRYALNVADIYAGNWKNSFYLQMGTPNSVLLRAYNWQHSNGTMTAGNLPVDVTCFDVIKSEQDTTIWQVIKFNDTLKLIRRVEVYNDTNPTVTQGNIYNWHQVGSGWFYMNHLLTPPTDLNTLILPGLKLLIFGGNYPNGAANLLNFPTPLKKFINGASMHFVLENESLQTSTGDDGLGDILPKGSYPLGYGIQRVTLTDSYTIAAAQPGARSSMFREYYIDISNQSPVPFFGPWRFTSQTLAEIAAQNTKAVADITLPAGTATMPALVLTPGVNAQNPAVPGALNFDGTNLYFTDKNGVTHQLAVVT